MHRMAISINIASKSNIIFSAPYFSVPYLSQVVLSMFYFKMRTILLLFINGFIASPSSTNRIKVA